MSLNQWNFHYATVVFYQEVIRASVTQDQNATQAKVTPPSLALRLPMPTGESGEKTSQPSATVINFNKDSKEENKEDEEDKEDEDDWDAFQSFPASTNAAGTDSKVGSTSKEPVPIENSMVSEVNAESDFYQEEAIFQRTNSVNDISGRDQQDVEGEVISDTQGDKMSPRGSIPREQSMEKESVDLQTHSSLMKPSDHQNYEREEEVVPNQEWEDKARLSETTEQVPAHPVPNEEDERPLELNLVKDEQLRKEYSDDNSEPLTSDPTPFDEVAEEKQLTQDDSDNRSKQMTQDEPQLERR